jgi:hypothetical protein
VPIRIDRFEDEDALDERPVSQRVIDFLLGNPDQAYTRTEIAGSTRIPRRSGLRSLA